MEPTDLCGDDEAGIRGNSQSGKGGVAWVIEQDKGVKLPKRLQAAFSRHVQQLADEAGRELNADDIWQLFKRTYLPGDKDRFVLVDYEESGPTRSEEHTSELQSLMRISYAVFCLKTKKTQ